MNLVCGRCGTQLALNSHYCPIDRWVLYRDMPDALSGLPSALVAPALPDAAGFLARRRQEGHVAHLEREFSTFIEAQLDAGEAEIEQRPDDAAVQRRMGLLALLSDSLERANAHFERAHQLDPSDLETHINYAVTLARRGRYQPALALVEEARKVWPSTPSLLFNGAVIALQARRPRITLRASEALEYLWQQNLDIATDFHDETMTIRGLALLMLGENREAETALLAAARHQVSLPARGSQPSAADVSGTVQDEEINWDEWDDSAASESGETLQLEKKGDSADLLNNLAVAEAEQGQLDRAASRLAAALRIDPGNTAILNNLGVLAYRHGQYRAALKYLQAARSIEEESQQREVHTASHLGAVLTALGQSSAALEMYEQAGTHEHAQFEVFYNLGRAYIEHGKPDKGVAYLRQAFKSEPNHADLHALLAAAYLMRGQDKLLPDAVKHLKRALQLSPRHRTALAGLVMAWHASGHHQAAVDALTQAVKTDPENVPVLFLLAAIAMRQGNETSWSKAGTQFAKLAARRPDLISFSYNEALCQFLLGMRDTAAKVLDGVIKRDPAFAPAYFLMGLDHAVSKRWDEALAVWLKAVTYDPRNGDLHANIGYIYFQREDFQKAVKHYTQAHRLLPNNSDVLAALGICFARAGLLPQAIAAFQQSIAINPLAPVTHSNLGLAFYLFKKIEAAMDEWRIVSQLDSGYAAKREEEQYRVYDSSVVQLMPFDWNQYVIGLAPPLPHPHTNLVPGYNARTYRPLINDSEIKAAAATKRELDLNKRLLAAMNVR